MDPRVMELRIRQWIPVFEEQAKSGLNKDEWCIINGINRGSFFRWQRRVRSYLLEHGKGVAQLSAPPINEQAENECFVELPLAQAALPGMAALRNLHDDVMDEAAPVSIRYGEFVVNVNGEVDERQLAAVLRALKNAE
ncbi:MAG: hypothetical protein IJX67_06510 [Oscillospiraceae bacterium]|nr:hypothetical protein [Oscillospiraceae bacterium]